MSFITLKSALHNNYVSSSESAATFTNNFEVPIVLGEGNTLQLVSCSIRKPLAYTISSNNNTFYWRIGVGAYEAGGWTPELLTTPYEALQHKVTIPTNIYTGDALAAEIALQLNNTTLIGMFKGGWTCVYTEVNAGGIGTKWDLAWTQIGAPPESEKLNGQIFTNVYDLTGLMPIVNGFTQTFGAAALPTPPFSPNNGFKFTNPTNVNTGAMIRQLNTTLTFENIGNPVPTSARSDDAYNELSLSYLGDKSIFANGGIITNIIRPVAYIEDYQWIRAGPPVVADVCFTNWNNGPGVQVTATASATPAGPELTLGWTTTLTLPALTVPAGPLYMFTDSGGCVGISDDPTKAAVEDTCTFGFFKPESNDAPAYSATAYLAELTNVQSSAPGAADPTAVLMSIHADFAILPAIQTPFVIDFGTTYANSQTGFVRSALQNPDNFTDSNQNYSADPGDADIQVNMITKPDNTGILVDVWYMNDQTGITFPEPGWRQAAAAISGMDLAGALAAASPGFVFGQSSYRVDIKVDKIKNLMVTIAHNALGGDAVGWGAETVIAVSGLLAGNLPLRPIEAHYPLRPFITSATGLPFHAPLLLPYIPDNNGLAQQYVGGVFDTIVTSQTGLDLLNIKLNPTTSSLIPPAVGAPGPVELPFLFKAGNIASSQIYYPPDAGTDTTISTNDVFENQANIQHVLAFDTVYNKRAPAVSHGAVSNITIAPRLTGNRNTIQVEIPEFNIESWSGRSADRGRAVGVIPTEEWSTGEDIGTLALSEPIRPTDRPKLTVLYAILFVRV